MHEQEEDPPLYIVYADADASNHESVQCAFRLEGATLEVVSDGEECLEAVWDAHKSGQRLPDMVLLASNLPKVGGVEVCRFLRKRFSFVQLPIIMALDATLDESIEAALAAGCSDCIAKPFSSKEIVARADVQRKICKDHARIVNQLGKQLAEAEQHCSQLRRSSHFTYVIKDAERLSTELEKTKSSCRCLEAKTSKLKEDLEQAEQFNKTVRETLQEANASSERLQDEKRKLKAQLAVVEMENEELQKSNMRMLLSVKLSEAKEDCNSWNTELERVKQREQQLHEKQLQQERLKLEKVQTQLTASLEEVSRLRVHCREHELSLTVSEGHASTICKQVKLLQKYWMHDISGDSQREVDFLEEQCRLLTLSLKSIQKKQEDALQDALQDVAQVSDRDLKSKVEYSPKCSMGASPKPRLGGA